MKHRYIKIVKLRTIIIQKKFSHDFSWNLCHLGKKIFETEPMRIFLEKKPGRKSIFEFMQILYISFQGFQEYAELETLVRLKIIQKVDNFEED